VSRHTGLIIPTSYGRLDTTHQYDAEFGIEQCTGIFRDTEEHTPVSDSSLACSPRGFFPAGNIVSTQPAGQHAVSPFDHSVRHPTTSMTTQDHGFGSQQNSIPLGTGEMNARVDMLGDGKDMTRYETKPAM